MVSGVLEDPRVETHDNNIPLDLETQEFGKEIGNNDTFHESTAKRVTIQEEHENKLSSFDVIQRVKQKIYEFEVLNRCVMDQSTTLKSRNEYLLKTMQEWK